MDEVMMTSIKDIAYSATYIEQIYTKIHKRLWVLIKLRVRDSISLSPYVVAQWEPIYQGGAFIISDKHIITLSNLTNIEWIVMLGQD